MRTVRVLITTLVVLAWSQGISLTTMAQGGEPDLSCYDSINIDGIFAPKPGDPTLAPCDQPPGPAYCADIVAMITDDDLRLPTAELRQQVFLYELQYARSSGPLGPLRAALRFAQGLEPLCI